MQHEAGAYLGLSSDLVIQQTCITRVFPSGILLHGAVSVDNCWDIMRTCIVSQRIANKEYPVSSHTYIYIYTYSILSRVRGVYVFRRSVC